VNEVFHAGRDRALFLIEILLQADESHTGAGEQRSKLRQAHAAVAV